MLIQLDLNMNDALALLHHCTVHHPSSGDFRENARLADALETLAAALNEAMHLNKESIEPRQTVDPHLLDAAIRLFGDREKALDWLSRPVPAFGQKSPGEVPIEKARTLISRIEHGFGA